MFIDGDLMSLFFEIIANVVGNALPICLAFVVIFLCALVFNIVHEISGGGRR